MASITKDDELSSFDVPEVTRHSSGHTLYKIVLQITPKEFTENSYQLVYWKRYDDIRKLYDVLHRYHQAVFRPGKFPDFPEKSRFMERFNPTVAEERRIATKTFLNFALQQLYLRTHEAYINFFQKGEKVLLPDVETDTLKPESIIPQSKQISTDTNPVLLPSPVKSPSKTDELLLTVDEEEQIENVSNTCAKILDDLNDLQFEQQEEIDKEKAELKLINDDVDAVANLLSLPLASTNNTSNSS